MGVTRTAALESAERKAAEQGDAEAQYRLGLMYKQGQGVAEDDTEAVKWLRKAADQGVADAAEVIRRLEENQDKGIFQFPKKSQ